MTKCVGAVPLQLIEEVQSIIDLDRRFRGRKKRLWRCRGCGAWLGAIQLDRGPVVEGVFRETTEAHGDVTTIGMVAADTVTRDRHAIKCRRCGVVNRMRR